ncbi:MAG: F0F1 ATP synthase subunit A [Candidatus Acetothermia bacterium]
MERLGEKLVLQVNLLGMDLGLDIVTIGMTWIVMLVIILLAFWLRRGLSQDPEKPPSRRIVILEAIMELVEKQVVSGFESKRLRDELFSFSATLLLFLLFSNWLSVIPALQSPTRNLNVPIGLALLVFVMSHYYGMKMNGPGKYLKSFFEPYPFMAPLNIVSELAKPLSHSFRLFGNVFGGAVLVTVISARMIPYVLPAALNLFYGLFIGAIHAFVFVLLAVAYINVAVE